MPTGRLTLGCCGASPAWELPYTSPLIAQLPELGQATRKEIAALGGRPPLQLVGVAPSIGTAEPCVVNARYGADGAG